MDEEKHEMIQQTEDAQPKQGIFFDASTAKPPLWYDYGPAFGAVLCGLAVAAVCVFMILERKPLPVFFGAVTLAGFGAYLVRYLISFARSRKLRTKTASLDDAALSACCEKWTKCFPLDEIVFTMSYSSSTNLCIIAATDTDYLTISCSCGFLLAKNGKQTLRPFYALNKELMQINPSHINYVRNKRYRKKNPFQIPLFVFETEYDTARTEKLVDTLRDRYRFR